MSTPIEIYSSFTGDSVFVDEYGLVSIDTKSQDGHKYAELDLPDVLELIEQLTKAAQELVRKQVDNAHPHRQEHNSGEQEARGAGTPSTPPAIREDKGQNL